MSTVVEKTYLKVPIKSIIVQADRARKDFGRIPELAEGIRERGLINPLYVTDHPTAEGKYLLLAGERRYRACMVAGLIEVPVTFDKGVDPLSQKLIELDENMYRKDFEWQEEAELRRQIHLLKCQTTPNWKQQDTANLVGCTPQHLGQQVHIAEKIFNNPTLKAKIKNLDMVSAIKVIKQHEDVEKVDRLQKQGRLVLTSDLINKSCLVGIKELATASVDLLLTDPPYGIESIEAQRSSPGTSQPGYTLMSDTHNMTLPKVLVMLRTLAPELVRVLKPGAHCYVFCAYQYVGQFIDALAPLQYQPPLLHWYRNKSTGTGLGYNYLNRTEAIIMLHNPPRSKRLINNMYNLLEFPQVPDSMRVYPTEKPQALLKVLMEQSSITNDLVLDPFAGSASTLKAARICGRRSIGFEINPDSFKIAQMHLAGDHDGAKNLFEDKGDSK